MKIIAFYLPQFHVIPENENWWGKDFTEWTNVKNAKPIYKGHRQPKIPLNHNYYDLLNDDVKKWQSNLAKEYGVYGFCYYHYWFNGHMLLEKPMEQMLENKSISLPFCISWANEAWTKAWVGDEKKILIPQTYGKEKEWEEHFYYLLQFFKDSRYIKVDGKPLIIIYRPEVINCLEDMVSFWRKLAGDKGLPGLYIVSQSVDQDFINSNLGKCLDAFIEFQPSLARTDLSNQNKRFMVLKTIRREIAKVVEKKIGIDLLRYGQNVFSKLNNLSLISYDDAWDAILKRKPTNTNSYPGAFVKWDNSPRHGNKARIYVGESPEKFKNYLTIQIRRTREIYHKDMLFMYAWNEWAEGGYLEPDIDDEYSYLKALKDALKDCNELPQNCKYDG